MRIDDESAVLGMAPEPCVSVSALQRINTETSCARGMEIAGLQVWEKRSAFWLFPLWRATDIVVAVNLRTVSSRNSSALYVKASRRSPDTLRSITSDGGPVPVATTHPRRAPWLAHL